MEKFAGKEISVEGLSSIFVRPCSNCGSMKAIVSFLWNGLVVRGMKLIEKDGSMFMGMPSRKKGEEWEDVCFFIDTELKKQITEKVIAEYELMFQR